MLFIIDKALEKRKLEGNPIRVGMIGAGFMARGIAWQLCQIVPGIKLVAISNRHLDGAKTTYTEAGISQIEVVYTVSQLEECISRNKYAVTDDALLLCQAEGIDAIVEVTGAIEFGAQVIMKAIEHKKHVIMMNAEVDGTVGPILKVYADKAGVILTGTDGGTPAHRKVLPENGGKIQAWLPLLPMVPKFLLKMP
jgi:predicted homoserine dehydrogenase-like protein